MTTAIRTGLKARVKRTDLLKVLRPLIPLTRRNKIVTVLSGVKITTHPQGAISLMATDMVVMAEVTVPADVMAAGVTVVPARELGAMIDVALGDEVHLEVQDAHLIVRCGDDRFSLYTMSPELFPGPTTDDLEPFFVISRADLSEMVTAVSPWISDDESKPWVQRIHIMAGEGLKVTAANAVGLATWDRPSEIHSTGQALVEAPGLKLAASLAAPGEPITVSRAEETLKLEGHNFTVWVRNSTDKYPDVRRLVPLEYLVRATVDRRAFVGAVRLGMTFGGKTRITVWQGAVDIAVDAPEVGSFQRKLAATVTGEMVEPMGWNPILLAKALNNLKGSEVRMELAGARNPARFVCDDQPHITYVVLPLTSF